MYQDEDEDEDENEDDYIIICLVYYMLLHIHGAM